MKTALRVIRDLALVGIVLTVLSASVLIEHQGGFNDPQRLSFFAMVLSFGPIAYGFVALRRTLQRLSQERLSKGLSVGFVRLAEVGLFLIVLPVVVGCLCWAFLPVFERADR